MEKQKYEFDSADPVASRHDQLIHEMQAHRESLGLSLHDISVTTKISPSILDAVEHLNFALLPEPVYARGFIKTYCQVVGIESDQLLMLYEQHREHHERSQPYYYEQPQRPTRPDNHRNLVIWLIAALTVGIFLYFFYFSQKADNSPVTESPSAAETAERKISEPDKSVKPPSVAQEAPLEHPRNIAGAEAPPTEDMKFPEATNDAGTVTMEMPEQMLPSSPRTEAADSPPYTLSIAAHELSWLKVTEDGKISFIGLLREGDKIERTASEQFIVDIGNAGGVTVEFGGKSLGSLGKSGETVHLKLPLE